MTREPIILLITSAEDDASAASAASAALEAVLRGRYVEGYRVAAAPADADPDALLRPFRDAGEQIALLIYVTRQADRAQDLDFLAHCGAVYPDARWLLIADTDTAAQLGALDFHLPPPYDPPETRLYPAVDELLAEWRASVNPTFARVSGIMTVRTVRIRLGDSLHRAAEIIALSGIGDLMVIDNDNNFVGVLSVGDVLRAAMPDVDEIMEEGGTLDQAYKLFLRRGSELMYQPIEPLVITNPLVVAPDDHVAKAAALMLERNIHRLPVVEAGRLVGTVGRTDVCQAVVGTL